jgi:methylenetetrahydrofolate dehydrogenase (NADP+) / methenyltetrahydrofolate cyclohydrolase
MGKIIDGKAVAQSYRDNIKEFVQNQSAVNKRVPCIATIMVGDDGGSLFYIKSQNKLCSLLGVEARDMYLDESISEEELISLIESLNEDSSVDGIMLQLPLPSHLDEKAITSKISYKKDVDGLTDINMGKFYKGEKSFVPCTPSAVIELVKSTGEAIQGKHVVIIGRSNIVGKPAAQLFLNENATVTICHSKTKDLKGMCKQADILVAAIGKPCFVTADYVKEGAIVIDVGTSRVNDKICGDVKFDEVVDIASYITPVPGGVGAMTTTMLIENVCEGYRQCT